MDKASAAWYTRLARMKYSASIIPYLLAAALPLQAAQQQRPSPQRWDVEGMYIQARATLEDRSNEHVEGVPVLLEACAREGHTEAMRLLLDVYEGKFKGLPARPEQAFHSVKLIADSSKQSGTPEGRLMQAEACYRLALYLERGFGCKVNDVEAYEQMERAAALGLGKARAEQCRYLMQGKGHKQDTKRAWKLLRYQVELDPTTPNVFFYMCYRGIGHKPDYRKARKLFSLGAQVNDANCLNNLAAMYERGLAVPRSEELALSLYRKAAAMGNREASANMQRLAFKVGIIANKKDKRTAAQKIHSAAVRVIQALPLSPYTRSRIRARLLGSSSES